MIGFFMGLAVGTFPPGAELYCTKVALPVSAGVMRSRAPPGSLRHGRGLVYISENMEAPDQLSRSRAWPSRLHGVEVANILPGGWKHGRIVYVAGRFVL